VLSYNGGYFRVDAVVGTTPDGEAIMRVTDSGTVDPAAYQNCEPATLSADFHLFLSVILYENISGWASLIYVPSEDGSVIFRVTAAGLY